MAGSQELLPETIKESLCNNSLDQLIKAIRPFSEAQKPDFGQIVRTLLEDGLPLDPAINSMPSVSEASPIVHGSANIKLSLMRFGSDCLRGNFKADPQTTRVCAHNTAT